MTDEWRGWTRARIEHEYSPSRLIESLDDELRRYAQASAAAMQCCAPEVVDYGDGDDETVDVYRCGLPSSPLLVYLHGGYWQALSKRESSFMVPGLLADGIDVAVVDYTLAPARPLAGIVDQCRRATATMRSRTSGRLVVAGSSAGAHLAAMVTSAADCGVDGAVLLSGVYDLRPLVETYVNDALGLDDASAIASSPMLDARPDRRELSTGVPTLVAVGRRETSEFHRQSAAYAGVLHRSGRLVGTAAVLVEDRHHFDLPFDLGDASTTVGMATRRLLGI